MNIYFKYESRGELTLRGFIFGIEFDFQAYNRVAWIDFPNKNISFILKESELPHFCSFMRLSEAKWLIRKGLFFYIISLFAKS